MNIKRSALLKCLYLESLTDKSSSIAGNDNIRLRLSPRSFRWTIHTAIYQATVFCVDPTTGAHITDPTGFDIAVNANKFFAVLGALKDETVDFVLNEKTLRIKDSTLSILLPLVDVHEMTDEIEVNRNESTIDDWNGNVLDGIDKLTSFTDEKGNGDFTGIFVKKDGTRLRMWATDRASAHLLDRTVDGDDNFQFILPRELVTAIGKLNVFTSNDKVRMLRPKTGNVFGFSWEGANKTSGYIASRIQGTEFRVPTALFDATPTTALTVDSSDVVTTLKLYRDLTDIRMVTLNFTNNLIKVAYDTFEKIIPFTGATFDTPVEAFCDVKKAITLFTAVRDGVLGLHDNFLSIHNPTTKETSYLMKLRRF